MDTNKPTNTAQNAPTPNVLEIAARKQAAFTRGLAETNGYETISTFYGDLTIAEEMGGAAGVRETFDRVNKEWRHDYRYYTEFVLALNWKIWEWYKTNEPLAAVYNELWEQADKWACDNLTGEAAEHYYNVTD